MLQNKIDGVQPFNAFHYKSCYYHQLIAGLACFNIDSDNIFMNSFVEIKEDFLTEKKEILNEKEHQKFFGYKKVKCNITKRKLIKFINKGEPIIVGVDCYCLKNRKDTYMLKHAPHYILVYGYDFISNKLNIIDHCYENSSAYDERIVCFEDILWANKMFKKNFAKDNKTCHVLKKKKKKEYENLVLWKALSRENWIDNHNNSLKNLEELMALFLSDFQKLKEKSGKIEKYLQDLKCWMSILSEIKIFFNDLKIREKFLLLHNAYSNFSSYFSIMKLKNNYNCKGKMLDSIVRKIDEMIILENDIYQIIMRLSVNEI